MPTRRTRSTAPAPAERSMITAVHRYGKSGRPAGQQLGEPITQPFQRRPICWFGRCLDPGLGQPAEQPALIDKAKPSPGHD
jgi:hypothetical protein